MQTYGLSYIYTRVCVCLYKWKYVCKYVWL